MEIKQIGRAWYFITVQNVHIRLTIKRPVRAYDGATRFRCPCGDITGNDLYIYGKLVNENYRLVELLNSETHCCGLQHVRIVLTEEFVEEIEKLFEGQRQNNSGNLFPNIDCLANADPTTFSICLATNDRDLISLGEPVAATLQSVTKPFTFLYCLAKFGESAMEKLIGNLVQNVPYDSIELHKGRALNCCSNNGALICAALILQDNNEDVDQALQQILSHFGILFNVPQSEVMVDEDCVEDEMRSWRKNGTLVMHLQSQSIISKNLSPKKVVQLHSAICAICATSEQVIKAGLVLLHEGRRDGLQLFDQRFCKKVAAQLLVSGLYEDSIEFASKTGGLSKSGISGHMLSIFPRSLVVAGFSPPLSINGNSVRMLNFIDKMAEEFKESFYLDF